MKIKYKLPVLIVLVVFWRSTGIAYDSELAMNNFAHDLAQCAAYFMLVSNAPGLDETTSKKYFDAGASLGAISGQLTSEKLALARIELEMKTMKREMENDWGNISIINNKYGYFCKDLTENPESRLHYWLNKND